MRKRKFNPLLFKNLSILNLFKIKKYIYFNLFFYKLINNLMRDGKKYKAEKIVYQFLLYLRNFKYKGNFYFKINKIILKLLPSLDKRLIKNRFYMPVLITKKASISLAVKWFIKGAKMRTDARTIAGKLFKEFWSILDGSSNSYVFKMEHYSIIFSAKKYLYNLKKFNKFKY